MAERTDRRQMDQLILGVLATSSKENELRLPIHPQHLDRIDADLRSRIFLEEGYGDRFGISRSISPPRSGAFDRVSRSSRRATLCCCPSPPWTMWPLFATVRSS